MQLGTRDLHLHFRLQAQTTAPAAYYPGYSDYSEPVAGGYDYQAPQLLRGGPAYNTQPAPRASVNPYAPAQYALYVNTYPDNARVELVNYPQPYRKGMALPQGRYQLYISAPGYMPRTQWVDIRDQEVVVPVTLSPPPRCYSAHLRDSMNPTQTTQHTLELQFSGPYVNGAYTKTPLPYGSPERMTLSGQAQGQTLDVIATYYRNANLLETQGRIYLQDTVAHVQIGGNQIVLQSAACP